MMLRDRHLVGSPQDGTGGSEEGVTKEEPRQSGMRGVGRTPWSTRRRDRKSLVPNPPVGDEDDERLGMSPRETGAFNHPPAHDVKPL